VDWVKKTRPDNLLPTKKFMSLPKTSAGLKYRMKNTLQAIRARKQAGVVILIFEIKDFPPKLEDMKKVTSY
jgi:hypothetical protein